MADDKKEEKEEPKQRYVVKEMATETKPVIVDTEEKDEAKAIFDTEGLLVKMANDLEVIKKGLMS